MTDDEVFESLYPEIAWRTPIRVTRTDGATGLGCRFCVARTGLKASEIPGLFASREAWEAHMKQKHELVPA